MSRVWIDLRVWTFVDPFWIRRIEGIRFKYRNTSNDLYEYKIYMEINMAKYLAIKKYKMNAYY